MLGSSYPLLDAFWTILWVFCFMLWIALVFYVFVDIFRSHDLSGWAKGLWAVAIIILPLFGVLMYLIVRGSKMQQHEAEEAQEQDAAFRSYVQSAAQDGSATSPADEVAKLADLRSQHLITDAEFEEAKSKVLGKAS